MFHGPFFSHLLFYFLCFAFLAFSLFYDCNLSSTVLRGKLLLRIISCAFFLKELFVRANRKCIFTGNYVTRGKIDSFK